MSKKFIVFILVTCGLLFYPLGWMLFPWAQSIGAIELSDGTHAIFSPHTGTWVIKLGAILSVISIISAVLVGVFYRPFSVTKD